MSEKLYRTCIYAIAKAETLDAIYKEDNGKGELEEDKTWATAKDHLGEARRHKEKLPILFADAADDSSSLIYWAVLEEITLSGAKTRYRFSGLRPLLWGEHATQDLILENTGKRIAPGFIRSYAICRTPPFLSKEFLDAEGSAAAPLDPETQ